MCLYNAAGRYTLLVIFCMLAVAATSQVRYAEWFLDTDPGYGNGETIAFTKADSVELNFNVDLTEVSTGLHMLYFRAQNINSAWSQTNATVFLKVSEQSNVVNELVRVEYFFDTDPGYGNGQAIAITAGADSLEINQVLDLSALEPGLHNVYVRASNVLGSWSQVFHSVFLVQSVNDLTSEISRAEYFFDTDPGYGNGQAIAITAGADSLEINQVLDLSALEPGLHNVYVRAANTRGNWSQVFHSVFLVQSVNALAAEISRAEYFLETDPGFGNGTPLTISAADSVVIAEMIDLSAYADGDTLILYVRAQNTLGFWSEVYSYEFAVTSNTAPAFTDQIFSIEENSANGTLVGTLEATDAEGDTLLFSLDSANVSDAFVLSSTGELSVSDV